MYLVSGGHDKESNMVNILKYLCKIMDRNLVLTVHNFYFL